VLGTSYGLPALAGALLLILAVPLVVAILSAPSDERLKTLAAGAATVALVGIGSWTFLVRKERQGRSGSDAVRALVEPGLLLWFVIWIVVPWTSPGSAVKAAIPLGAGVALVASFGKAVYERIEVACECRNELCHEPIAMRAGVYSRLRDSEYVVLPGHEDRRRDRIVYATEHYLVVTVSDVVSGEQDSIPSPRAVPKASPSTER
jgi:hypothetical protein